LLRQQQWDVTHPLRRDYVIADLRQCLPRQANMSRVARVLKRTHRGGHSMTNVKKVAIVGAVVAAIVPAVAFARKRVKAASKRKALMKTEGRKIAHAPKPRKARRISRHRAKSVAAMA
jgi:hypothetical protein